MTDTRCRYCLEHAATCETRRLFAGRSCCAECTHGSSPLGATIPAPPSDRPPAVTAP